MLHSLTDLLFPPKPNESLVQELHADVRFGTLVLGGFELLLSILFPLEVAVLAGAIGLATLGSTQLSGLYERLRLVSAASTLLWIALMVLLAPDTPVRVGAAAAVLCLSTQIPQTPLQALLTAVGPLALSYGVWPLPAIALASVALSPFQYRFRRERHEGVLGLFHSARELHEQQTRAVAAENAVAMERLAAAISHELNNPVGAIRSSAQTLQTIMGRYEAAGPERRDALRTMHADLCSSLVSSADRVHGIVARLQRLTGLDRAAVRPTDFNELIGDIAATVEAGTRGALRIALKLGTVPVIVCETQSWATILGRVMEESASRAGENGLEVTSSFRDEAVWVEVKECGVDLSRTQIGQAFIPRFATAEGGRVGTSNWGRFQLRGWVRQLGGEIRLSSETGGVTTRLRIPAKVMG